MTRNEPCCLLVVLLAGSLAACSEAASNDAADAAGVDQPVAPDAAVPGLATAEPAADAAPASADALAREDGPPPTAAPTATPTPTAPAIASAAAPAPARINRLPLKRGFYVASDTPCGQASNATLLLVTREGINASRTICSHERVEQAGPMTYRVIAKCSELSGGDESETSVNTYTVPNDTSFTITWGDGSQSSSRYCAQPSLPEPWRDNDISDIIG